MRRDVPLDGAWEQPGRNPLAAGIAGLLIVGGAYEVLSGVAGVAIGAIMASRGAAGPWGWTKLLQDSRGVFQVPLLALTMAVEFGVLLLLTVVLVRRWHTSRPFAYLSFGRPDALMVLLAGAGALAAVPPAEGLVRLLYAIFPELSGLGSGSDSLFMIDTPGKAVLVVFAVAITPAICEESLFRGWFQGTLRRRLHPAAAIAIQAAVFALVHLNPLSAVGLAFIGAYLGWLLEKSGTIYASMTAHCIYNAAVIVAANIQRGPFADGSGGFSIIVIAAASVLFAGAVVLIELRARKAADTLRQGDSAG